MEAKKRQQIRIGDEKGREKQKLYRYSTGTLPVGYTGTLPVGYYLGTGSTV